MRNTKLTKLRNRRNRSRERFHRLYGMGGDDPNPYPDILDYESDDTMSDIDSESDQQTTLPHDEHESECPICYEIEQKVYPFNNAHGMCKSCLINMILVKFTMTDSELVDRGLYERHNTLSCPMTRVETTNKVINNLLNFDWLKKSNRKCLAFDGDESLDIPDNIIRILIEAYFANEYDDPSWFSMTDSSNYRDWTPIQWACVLGWKSALLGLIMYNQSAREAYEEKDVEYAELGMRYFSNVLVQGKGADYENHPCRNGVTENKPTKRAEYLSIIDGLNSLNESIKQSRDVLYNLSDLRSLFLDQPKIGGQ